MDARRRGQVSFFSSGTSVVPLTSVERTFFSPTELLRQKAAVLGYCLDFLAGCWRQWPDFLTVRLRRSKPASWAGSYRLGLRVPVF